MRQRQAPRTGSLFGRDDVRGPLRLQVPRKPGAGRGGPPKGERGANCAAAEHGGHAATDGWWGLKERGWMAYERPNIIQIQTKTFWILASRVYCSIEVRKSTVRIVMESESKLNLLVIKRKCIWHCIATVPTKEVRGSDGGLLRATADSSAREQRPQSRKEPRTCDWQSDPGIAKRE